MFYKAVFQHLDSEETLTRSIKSSSYEKALEKTNKIVLPDYFLTNLIEVKSTHGGKREGSGAPQKFGEKTKAIRIPESLANNLDLIIAIPELQKLLDEWQKDCDVKPNSSRHYYLKKALADIRALGY